MVHGASSEVVGAAATRSRVPRDVPDTSATLGGGTRHCGEPYERPTPIPISPDFNGKPYRALFACDGAVCLVVLVSSS